MLGEYAQQDWLAGLSMETDCLDDTTGATSDSRVGNHPIEKAGQGSTEGCSYHAKREW